MRVRCEMVGFSLKPFGPQPSLDHHQPEGERGGGIRKFHQFVGDQMVTSADCSIFSYYLEFL